MKKQRKEKHFIKKPIFPGGMTAMRELIKKELVYPNKALENRVEGVVRLVYWVNYKGDVYKTEVLIGIGHGCDAEAERLVKLFKFKVSKAHKLKLKFRKTINIHFKLPKTTGYKVVYTNTAKSSDNEGKSSSIEYTINID